ncbi:outer membrane beta-barrel protein [Vibrio europaeus]|uniref:outer membrane beta-barrel protein n=1 Tax=Vibrio europaeus TaxID=300876 RepID=UPI00233EE1D7|nr:outer membrane beta-barrel protein [Vibrio europaeus]MDC5819322.1 outer membrane beta-barrel protein [Vibrio europaeus]MDC5872125.1 outer membrane beta-barrel protein [Vibrio europaeus]
MMYTVKKALSALALTLTASQVYAQFEGNGYVTQSGLKILPILDSRIEHNDNVGRYSDAESPESSTVFVIEPGIAFQSDRGGNTYQIAYQISSGLYTDSSDDNYVDHKISTNNSIILNSRNALSLNYAYLFLHEVRGTGILAGDSLSTIASGPVEYAVNDASIVHAFGSDEAKGRIETTLRLQDRKYHNYRDIQDPRFSQVSTRFKDYFEYGGGVAFYWRAFPATSLLFEIDASKRAYDLNDPVTNNSQDSVDIFYLTGATWDITGKTTGKLRFGLQDKSYDDVTRDDFSGFSWDLELVWEPLNYSKVTVSAAQRARDPDQGSNYVDETSFDGAWKHYWLSHLFTQTSLRFILDDYSESPRTDDLFKVDLSIGYELRDHVEINAGWRLEDNDSSVVGNSYDQNVIYFSANMLF